VWEDHEVDFAQEIRCEPLFDDAVDQRLHVLGVGGADDAVAGGEALAEVSRS
jgi:hypothetical protein